MLPEAPTGALPRLHGGDSLGVDSGAPGGTWARLPGDALGVDFGGPGGENVGKKMQQEAN